MQAEIERLTHLWGLPDSLDGANSYLGNSKAEPKFFLDSKLIEQASHDVLANYLDKEMLATIDPFDAVQLVYVIEVCIQHKNQAAAGRYLYASSRDKLKSPNDSNRLRKYLMRFGLKFNELGI